MITIHNMMIRIAIEDCSDPISTFQSSYQAPEIMLCCPNLERDLTVTGVNQHDVEGYTVKEVRCM